MVVDDVVDDGDAARVRRIDQAPQAVGAAIRAFDSKNIGRIVPEDRSSGNSSEGSNWITLTPRSTI